MITLRTGEAPRLARGGRVGLDEELDPGAPKIDSFKSQHGSDEQSESANIYCK